MKNSNLQSGMAKAKALSQRAMEDAQKTVVNGESDFARAQRFYAERARENRSEGELRGLEHNQALHIEAQKRKHGGFQTDMFADNNTGLRAA